jgi:YggT family protein
VASAGHLGPWPQAVKDAAGTASALRLRLFTPCEAARFQHHHSRKLSMRALFLVIDLALELYVWIVIAMAIFSWLVAFNVVNTRNPVVAMIGDFLYRITDPVLRPIRNMLPSLGGIDISPVILFLIIVFLRYVIALYILPNVY